MEFTKDDLQFTQYEWNNEQAHLFNGEPTRRSFNRYDGNQVLFLINYFGSMDGKFSVEEGRHVEELLQKEMPLDVRSELSAFNWIKNNIALEEHSIQ